MLEQEYTKIVNDIAAGVRGRIDEAETPADLMDIITAEVDDYLIYYEDQGVVLGRAVVERVIEVGHIDCNAWYSAIDMLTGDVEAKVLEREE